MCCLFSKQFLCNSDCSTAFCPRQFLEMLIHHSLFCSCLRRDPSLHHRDSGCWAPLELKAETPNRRGCDLVSCLFQLIRSASTRFSRSEFPGNMQSRRTIRKQRLVYSCSQGCNSITRQECKKRTWYRLYSYKPPTMKVHSKRAEGKQVDIKYHMESWSLGLWLVVL